MKKLCLGVCGLLVGCLLSCGFVWAAETPKQTPAEFYKGKDITAVVPWEAGGGMDMWMRLLAPFLQKYTGATVIVRNMPSAAGRVAHDYVYRHAKQDGLTLCLTDGSNILMADLLGVRNFQGELREYNWLARITFDYQVFLVGKNSRYRTLDQIIKAPEVKFGETNRPDFLCTAPLCLGVAFNLNNIKPVAGYAGSNGVRLSVLRGETDCCGGRIPSSVTLMKSGELVPLFVAGHTRDKKNIPHIPTIYEVAPNMTPEAKNIIDLVIQLMEGGTGLFTGPGVPRDRVTFLADAFAKCARDPELIAKADKAFGAEVLYLPGDEYYSKVIKRISETVPKDRTMIKSVFDNY